jgi:hypothetical protein
MDSVKKDGDMKLISSQSTFFHKRVFPFIWFGFLAFFVLSIVYEMVRYGDFSGLLLLIVPAAMAIIGYFIMKKLVLDLMDEVWDAGDSLVVKNKGAEEHILLSDIMNVSYSVLTNPTSVTLMLRRPCRWGREISFVAQGSFLPFGKNPLVLDLIERIDAKRRGA